MVLSFLKTEIRVSKSNFFLITILFFSFFTTYYVLISHLLKPFHFFGLDNSSLQMIFHFFAVIVLIITSSLINRISKIKLIYFCSIGNCVLIFLLLWNPFEIFTITVMFCIMFFVIIGLLTTFSVFGALTIPEERGRIGGLAGFVVFPFYFVINNILIANIDFSGAVILGIVINLLPLFSLITKSDSNSLEKHKSKQIRYFEKRVFILYFIPWIIFSIINSTLARNTTAIIQTNVSFAFYTELIAVQIIGIISGALMGGLIADLLGRRFSLVFSLTFFGFCTALVGLFENELVYLIVYGASGLTWGFLFVLYIFVVWGDLSNQKNRMQAYSIGLISYLLSLGLGSTINFTMSLFQSALLSVLIIFLLNLPIIFAPELLDSYVLEKIRMKQHMKKVKELQKKRQG